MTQTTREAAKELAIKHYIRRVRAALEKGQIDNHALPAGKPMFFYCKECGIQTETLPEDYLFQPYQHCSQCKGLMTEGWLEDAQSVWSQADRSKIPQEKSDDS